MANIIEVLERNQDLSAFGRIRVKREWVESVLSQMDGGCPQARYFAGLLSGAKREWFDGHQIELYEAPNA